VVVVDLEKDAVAGEIARASVHGSPSRRSSGGLVTNG
jgi:hypothetical protein